MGHEEACRRLGDTADVPQMPDGVAPDHLITPAKRRPATALVNPTIGTYASAKPPRCSGGAMPISVRPSPRLRSLAAFERRPLPRRMLQRSCTGRRPKPVTTEHSCTATNAIPYSSPRGTGEERRWDRDIEQLGSLEIEQELERPRSVVDQSPGCAPFLAAPVLIPRPPLSHRARPPAPSRSKLMARAVTTMGDGTTRVEIERTGLSEHGERCSPGPP